MLHGIEGVLIYYDDIFIWAENEDNLKTRVTSVLNNLNKFGLRLNSNKCIFESDSVDFLGYTVSANGIKPTCKHLDAIIKAPIPRDKSALQSFLGLVNFYHSFVPMKSDVLEPLNSLLRKNLLWVWSNKQQQAFDSIKKLLTSTSLLTHFDTSKPIVLTVDASPFGVGAVLSHRFKDGQERPIAFHSKALTAAERNYAQLDREALAIVVGVKKFHHFLYGHNFEIITDHKPLLGLLSSDRQIPEMISPRMLRWTIFLTSYNYTLLHRPGKNIPHADALSRVPIECNETNVDDTVFLLESWQDTPISPKEISTETKRDPVLRQIYDWVLNGWPVGKVSEKFVPYYRRRSELTLIQDCLLLGSRAVLPPSMHSKILKQLHISHPGIVRMKSLARSYVWWPQITKHIEELVASCKACQVHQKSPPVTKPYFWPKPLGPWRRLHIDFAGPFYNKMFLIVVDSYSKWVEVRHVSSTATINVVNTLRQLFATFGVPEVIVSDNGTSFTSSEFEQFLKANAIQFIRSPPFHPSSNGRAESAVQSTKSSLKKILYDVGNLTLNEWNLALSRFLLSQHVTATYEDGKTPAELMFGRKIRTCVDVITRSNYSISDLESNIKPNRDLPSDSCVRVRNYSRGDTWLPGVIKAKHGKVLYDVQLEDQRIVRRHLDQIRRRLSLNDNPPSDDSFDEHQAWASRRSTGRSPTVWQSIANIFHSKKFIKIGANFTGKL